MTDPTLRLFGLADLADHLGLSRDLVRKWNARGKLPLPDARLLMGPVWRLETIEAWQEDVSAPLSKLRP